MSHRPSYSRFIAMILISMVVMFILTYFNSFSIEHVHWSETRIYMTMMMGAAMAVIMLSFMLSMYRDRLKNFCIYLGSFIIFSLSLWLVRSQRTVEDLSWMRAMIPHHSIAVLTSERANIRDVRVRELADSIIYTQIKEIREMKWLTQDIVSKGIISSERDIGTRSVPYFDGNLNSSTNFSE